jgi:hypothetical protein
MSLASPALTTTSYKKRKEKITKAKQAELERDWRARNQRLREIGLPKETFEQFLEWIYGRGKKTKEKATVTQEAKTAYAKPRQGCETTLAVAIPITGNSSADNSGTSTQRVGKVGARNVWITGPCSSKPSPTYTGSEIIGITVMHKSCLQPVFSKEAAEDAAKMRR